MMKHLETAQVSVLSRHMHRSVSVLIHLIQRDALLLHELQQPEQHAFLPHTHAGHMISHVIRSLQRDRLLESSPVRSERRNG